MLKKIILSALVSVSALIVKSQNSYNSVGVTGSYFFPTSNKPIEYRSNEAQSIGLFYEHYFISNFKLKVGVNNFSTTYSDWYFDTSSTPKIFSFDVEAEFISLPLQLSYNFDATNNRWEFFVDAGYTLLIQQHKSIKNFPKNSLLSPYDRINKSNYYSYFTVGFSGRYKLHKDIYVGLGTRSFHYLKLNNNKGNGFPALSIDGSIAYVF